MTAPPATGRPVAAAAATGGPAALQAAALTYTYPGARRPALDAVDLDVPPGSLLALVGPSGCGKSTLLRLVAGLLPPTRGRLLLDGEDSAGTRPERRAVGWVPQSYGLFDHLDVRGNVGFGLRARRTGRRESADRVAEVLRLCRIDDLAQQRVDQLSGGQRQRVAIARALAVRPRVLLLDEPLAALDPELRTTLRVDLAALLRRSGVTTLLVTHDQGEALALADAVAVLRDGRLVQHGPPTELWEAPAEPFVATFVGGARVVTARCVAPGGVVLAPGLTGRPSRRVTGATAPIAVRPDDLIEDPGGIPFAVESVEYRGGRWRAVGALAGGPSVAVDLARPARPGEHVLVAVRPGARLTVVGR